MTADALPRTGRLSALAALLLLGLLVPAPTQAGAVVPQPCGGVAQIVDPNGDGHHASSDVLSAWFSEEGGRLQAVIKVKAGTWEPEHDDADLNGSGYAMIFAVGGSTAYVRARDWPHSERPVEFDYGAYAPGTWFTSAGPTSGEVTHAAFGGTVAIDVPAATGAIPGALLSGPHVLTYDGITAGVPDWVDQAPGGTAAGDAARGADYVVGSCSVGPALGAPTSSTVAVQLAAPAKVLGARRVRIRGKVIPARAGVDVALARRGASRRGVVHLTSGVDGGFATTLALRETTRLRASAEGISSQTVAVDVRSKVRIRVRRLRSGAVRVIGALAPALPGRLLLLGAGDVRPALTRRSESARFSLRLTPGRLAPGRYEVVYIPAPARAERSTSNRVRVR